MQDIMFSVAVITYNQEKYISQTLDSILNQEHDYKYEIVIGEDCSTDNTKKIIEEYVTKYPDIIKPLYNNPNKGLINNYFNVITHCQGKYIMECAGDDYWLPEKVEIQIDFMESNPGVGMCYGRAKVWNENKQKYEKKSLGSDVFDFENLLKNGCRIPALTVCFRSELVNKYISEIKPQEKDWLMEDFPMWLYFSHESKVKFFDKDTAVYRVLENSASHSVDVEKQFRFNKNIYNIREFYSKRFDISIEERDDEKELFYIYYRKNIKRYSSKNCIEMKNCLKRIKFKTKKEYIVSYVCGNRLFFILFRLFVSLFNWVKKC